MSRPRDRKRNPDGTFENAEGGRGPGNPGWQKGCKSPNPGGLPKSVKLLRDRIGAETKDGEEIIQFALNVMRGQQADMTDERVRWAAHEWLSDRYFGKVKQTVELTPGQADPDQPSTPPLRDLLLVLPEKDRNDLERILTNFEQARQEGRLMLPAGAVSVVDDGGDETPN